MTHDTDAPTSHPLGYGLLVAIWAGLLGLTAVTVGVAQVDLGFLNIVVALAVASIKASLVVFVFMHLKYENHTLKAMVALAFVILAIFIGFTFWDVGLR